MLSETKLGDTFTSAEFSINGFFAPHGLDHNNKDGGILLYVRETLIVLLLKRYSLPSNIAAMFFELNLRSKNGACVILMTHIKVLLKSM